jgi:DNA-binding HxlR family transcriptional regulator
LVKTTKNNNDDIDSGQASRITDQRTYGDPCGIARGLDLVGERWALLVVRELLLGPKRFTDLRSGLPNLSPDVLAQRLRELERSGVIYRHKLPPPAAARVYDLTEWGHELEPVVLALGRWGSRAPFPPAGAGLGVDSIIIALKTLFDPSAAAGHDAQYELLLGERRFCIRVTDGRLELDRGIIDRADAVIDTDPGALAQVLWHGRSLDTALQAGEVRLEGSRPAVNRFLTLFPAPVPARLGAPQTRE